MNELKFGVDLRGMIRLLSDHLYQDSNVYLRELLQNAIDAISARSLREPGYAGAIRVELSTHGAQPSLTVIDDGVGLTQHDLHTFLSTIGASSKLGDNEQTFLGRFGIGLLSGFLVSDEIVLVSQSSDTSQPAVEWRGRSDGTYTAKVLDIPIAVGTQVTLTAKEAVSDRFTAKQIERLSRYFGQYLPCPIYFESEGQETAINSPAPWQTIESRPDDTDARRAEYLRRGKELFGETFLDVIPLRCERVGLQGLAFVLPYAATLAARATHRTYLRGMLLTESEAALLPEWAFFLKAIVNVENLKPTAARDHLVRDEEFLEVARIVEDQVKSYLVNLVTDSPDRFDEILRLHYLPLKAVAVEDDALYEVLISGLPFETSLGPITLREHFTANGSLYYIDDFDDYRHAAPIARAQHIRVVNAGLVYDRQLLRKYEDLHSHCHVIRTSIKDLISGLGDLTAKERAEMATITSFAEQALNTHRCRVFVKHFQPTSLPAIFCADGAVELGRRIMRVRDEVDDLWKGVLAEYTSHAQDAGQAQLVLNYDNPLVQRMSQIRDISLLKTSLQLIYFQSLLVGHHPLTEQEHTLLGTAMQDLILFAIPEKH